MKVLECRFVGTDMTLMCESVRNFDRQIRLSRQLTDRRKIVADYSAMPRYSMKSISLSVNSISYFSR